MAARPPPTRKQKHEDQNKAPEYDSLHAVESVGLRRQKSCAFRVKHKIGEIAVNG
jgi:hypothetical protein